MQEDALFDLAITVSVILIGVLLLIIGIRTSQSSRRMLPLVGLAMVLGAATLITGGVKSIARDVEKAISPAKPQSNLPPLSEDQLRIIREVMQGAEVTAQLHKRFWQPFRNTGASTEQLNQFGQWITAQDPQQYQREVWTAAKRSYETRTVVRTSALDSMEKALLEKISPGSRGPISQSFQNTSALLTAAANRTPVRVPDREPMEISPAVIDHVLAGIDQIFARIQRLLDPTWRD